MGTDHAENLPTTLAALPKVDLHCHLEGAMRLETMVEIAQTYDCDVPARDLEGLRPYVQVTYEGGDFTQFLSKFPVLRKFHQSPEIIARFAREAIADAAADNVRYLELQFNPVSLASARGYDLGDVADWVITARRQAEKEFDIEVGLVLTINRMEPDQAPEVLQVALDRVTHGIVAVCLAGDEVNYSAEPFIDLFKRAHKGGLGVTVHAGEWMGAENVRYAIEELQTDRIGHGVRLVEDSAVVALARDRDMVFEVCITSNVQSGVVPSVSQHPVREMFKNHGLKVTLNTDDPRLSDVVLTDEYEIACTEFGFSIGDLKTMILTAAESAYLPEDRRRQLVAKMTQELVAFPDSLWPDSAPH